MFSHLKFRSLLLSNNSSVLKRRKNGMLLYLFLTSRPPRVITLSHNKTPTIRVYGKFKRRMRGDTMSGQVDRFTRDL